MGSISDKMRERAAKLAEMAAERLKAEQASADATTEPSAASTTVSSPGGVAPRTDTDETEYVTEVFRGARHQRTERYSESGTPARADQPASYTEVESPHAENAIPEPTDPVPHETEQTTTYTSYEEPSPSDSDPSYSDTSYDEPPPSYSDAGYEEPDHGDSTHETPRYGDATDETSRYSAPTDAAAPEHPGSGRLGSTWRYPTDPGAETRPATYLNPDSGTLGGHRSDHSQVSGPAASEAPAYDRHGARDSYAPGRRMDSDRPSAYTPPAETGYAARETSHETSATPYTESGTYQEPETYGSDEALTEEKPRPGGSIIWWLLPLLLAFLLIGAFLLWLLNRDDDDEPSQNDDQAEVADETIDDQPETDADANPDGDGVDGNGDTTAPEVDLEALQGEVDAILDESPLEFEEGESEVGDEASETLNKVADVLSDTGVDVTVSSFTSTKGNAEANAELTENRALALLDALVELGVDPDAIEADGRGEDDSKGDNGTEMGRAANERIEITLS